MSIRNPTQARAGNRACFAVAIVQNRLFRHVVALHSMRKAGAAKMKAAYEKGYESFFWILSHGSNKPVPANHDLRSR